MSILRSSWIFFFGICLFWGCEEEIGIIPLGCQSDCLEIEGKVIDPRNSNGLEGVDVLLYDQYCSFLIGCIYTLNSAARGRTHANGNFKLAIPWSEVQDWNWRNTYLILQSDEYMLNKITWQGNSIQEMGSINMPTTLSVELEGLPIGFLELNIKKEIAGNVRINRIGHLCEQNLIPLIYPVEEETQTLNLLMPSDKEVCLQISYEIDNTTQLFETNYFHPKQERIAVDLNIN